MKKSKRINMLSSISLKNKLGKDNYYKEYLETIKCAINHKDGYNIAISGSYGTGKSSIIKTYRDCPKMKSKSILISIGSFLKTKNENDSKKNDEKEKNTVNQNSEDDKENNNNGILSNEEEQLMEKIEKNIVKQLIYRLDYSKSKLSSIKRLQKNWKFKYILYSFAFVYCFAFLYYYFINKDFILKMINDINNYYFKNSTYTVYSFFPALRTIFIILLLILCLKSIYSIFVIINKAKTKIKIRNYELEIDNSKEKFSFMENLYEILYYFINSKVEVVFFEDLDRYQKDVCIKVIEDLKELNSIINNCYGMNGKYVGRKKVVFVYSFKDSIFYKATEKNKFYDYIISVMPIATKYTTPMRFITEFDNYGINISDFDGDLLNIASMYINDMRTIKNIINDYNLFYNILKQDFNESEKNQLLAMCIYKNIEIEKYDELLEYDNNLDKIIKDFEEIIQEEIKNDKNKLKEDILTCKNSILKIKKELLEYNSLNGIEPQLIIISRDITIDDFLSFDFDVETMLDSEISVVVNGIKNPLKYGEKIEYFVNTILDSKKEIKELNYKVLNLEQIISGDINELYKYSKKYINDISNGKRKKHSKIDDELFKSIAFKLVYSGYIRKNYIDYISSPVDSDYFTIRDSRFIFGYNLGKHNYDVNVDHPDRIINYLGNMSLNYSTILNNDIIQYLYINELTLYKEIILNQFKDISNEKMDYLKQLKKNNNILYKLLIFDLSDIFYDFWNSFNDKSKKKLLIDDRGYKEIVIDIALLKELNIDKINDITELKMIISNYLKSSIIISSKSNDFFDNDNKLITTNLKKMNIKIKDLYSFMVNDEKRIIELIVKNDLYELNINNLSCILGIEKDDQDYHLIDFNELKKLKLYSYLKKSIINNLIAFASNIYLNKEYNYIRIEDQELIKEIIIEISNIKSEKLFDDASIKKINLLLEELIKREEFIIDSYSIPIEYYKMAYDYNHISIDWYIIKEYSTGITIEDRDLLKIAIENIDSFYNKDVDMINTINNNFMNNLINKLYSIENYKVLNIIFKNYDIRKIKKDYARANDSKEKLENMVNNNYIKPYRKCYINIKNICGNEILYKYIKNILKEKEFDKIYDLIDKDGLITLKKEFSPNENIKSYL